MAASTAKFLLILALAKVGGGKGINRSDVRNSISIPLNENCYTDEAKRSVSCVGVHYLDEISFPLQPDNVRFAEFVNCTDNLPNLLIHFPNLEELVVKGSLSSFKSVPNKESLPTLHHLRVLNVSYNNLKWSSVSGFLRMFPNLEILDLSHNSIQKVKLGQYLEGELRQLKFVDISGNPLDCTLHFEWLDTGKVTLLRPEETLCEKPSHQNKPKPIHNVWKLISQVRAECRLNCSCSIVYIWEQNHVIHSKNLVNCSHLGFQDFPDPSTMPNPTDILDLSNNEIKSIRSFLQDKRYEDLGVMNLHLDSNQIQSIALLEASDWFDSFQIFTFRNNSIQEVPVYVLENAFALNKNILQIDLSLNPFRCDCTTISTLKGWLLKHSENIKHIDEVVCAQTGQQIRYLRHEEWCKVELGEESLIEALDILSIIMALLILVIISKVYYDYYNFKHKGKLPWLVRKM